MNRPPQMLNEKEKRSPISVALSVLLSIVMVVLVVFLAFNVYVGVNCYVVEVSGQSMDTTLYGGEVKGDGKGDRLYAYKNAKPKRGDVVVIDVTEYPWSAQVSGSFFIKRIIATEGDRLRIRDGVVEIMYAGENEYEALSEPYTSSATAANGHTEWFVEEGEVFCMGDNRAVSLDSRMLGCFKTEDVTGVVPQWAITIKPLSSAWERFRESITKEFNVRGE